MRASGADLKSLPTQPRIGEANVKSKAPLAFIIASGPLIFHIRKTASRTGMRMLELDH